MKLRFHLSLLIPAWLGMATLPADAQTNLLVDWGSTWSYWANTNNYTIYAAVPWCTNTFDDSGWPTKAGIIWAESDLVSVESLPGGARGGNPSYNPPALATTNAYGAYIWTYYFRTHFRYDGPLSGIALQLETIFDDGVVYYLNGRELPGTRLNMTGGMVQWSTGANWSREASEAVLTNVVINPSHLRMGDNVLAAEVHQGATASSDMVFGMRLLGRTAFAPVIATNPVPLIMAEMGILTNMSVVVGSGELPLSYQWYSAAGGGVPTNRITGATAATYAFVAHPTNSLDYWCVVTNVCGRATSSVCAVNGYSVPLVFTLQPTNQTLNERDGLMMAAAVTGSEPAYRWQKYTNLFLFNTNHALTSTGWTNISAAFNASAASNTYVVLEQVGLKTNEAGFYRLTVTNWTHGATSAVAALTVLVDGVGPIVVSAEGQEDAGCSCITNIQVTFSENVLGSLARAISNYSVIDLSTGATHLIGRITGGGSALKVVTLGFDAAAALPVGTNHLYRLTVNNLRDLRNNVMAPESQVAVQQRYHTVFVPAEAVWRWNEDNVPLMPDWTTNYLEGVNTRGAPVLYGEGPGAFAGGSIFPEIPCPWAAVYTPISMGASTHYFSTRFELPDVAPDGTAALRFAVDDGVVFYLNGAEIGRWNMPAGPVGHDTSAAVKILDFQLNCTNLAVTVTNLSSGANHLAAEVHQFNWPGSDVLFCADFSGTFKWTPKLPPEEAPGLALERNGGQLTLSWQRGGYALETTTNLASRWLEVQPDMANPYTTGLTNGVQRFWRLKQKQF